MNFQAITAGLGLMFLLMPGALIAAPLSTQLSQQPTTLSPPADATQSINYWKPHIIDPERNQAVARAHQIFSRLLRTWDGSRIEPSLYVVRSDAGPWAASLLDGNILLSYQAIKISNSFGKAQSQDLLAFVLAHELAHQRSNDLWHYKFFRLAGSQAPAVRRQILQGVTNSKAVQTLERREAQADHDGLTIMSVVGYDPFRIVDKKDFFTQWVESIWQLPCAGPGTSKTGVKSYTRSYAKACNKARTRALRTRTQLKTVAVQSVLYDLGVQSYIAGRNETARRYFRAYGRDYPSRAVYNAIGLTYLAQALDLRRPLLERGLLKGPQFFYPLVLDASPKAQKITRTGSARKRGQSDNQTRKQRKLIKKFTTKAINYFEKARRLEPEYRNTYLLSAMAQLVKNNTYVARGVVQGELMPRFGRDMETDLLMAMINAQEGKFKESEKLFKKLLKTISDKSENNSILPRDLLTYAVHHNYAAMETARGNLKLAKKIWQDMAKKSRNNGESLLFRLALNQVNTPHHKKAAQKHDENKHLSINNRRIGDPTTRNSLSKQYSQISNFWYEGDRMKLYRYVDGSRLVLGPKKKVLGIWQGATDKNSIGDIKMGDEADRPLKVFGLPSRSISMVSGDYLAYDKLGLALLIVSGRVQGWFLYEPVS